MSRLKRENYTCDDRTFALIDAADAIAAEYWAAKEKMNQRWPRGSDWYRLGPLPTDVADMQASIDEIGSRLHDTRERMWDAWGR